MYYQNSTQKFFIHFHTKTYNQVFRKTKGWWINSEKWLYSLYSQSILSAKRANEQHYIDIPRVDSAIPLGDLYLEKKFDVLTEDDNEIFFSFRLRLFNLVRFFSEYNLSKSSEEEIEFIDDAHFAWLSINF